MKVKGEAPPRTRRGTGYVLVRVDLRIFRKLIAENFDSMTKFAEACGLDKSAVSRILNQNRRISPETFSKIKAVLPGLAGIRYVSQSEEKPQ